MNGYAALYVLVHLIICGACPPAIFIFLPIDICLLLGQLNTDKVKPNTKVDPKLPIDQELQRNLEQLLQGKKD